MKNINSKQIPAIRWAIAKGAQETRAGGKKRQARQDYQLLKKILNNPDISEAKKKLITDLLSIKSLNFKFLSYNSEKEGEKSDKATRGTALIVTASSMGVGGLYQGGPLGAAIGAGTGVTAGLISHYIKVIEAYTDYTEPQRKLLEQLKLYRDAIRLIDLKAKPTLADFEEFVRVRK